MASAAETVQPPRDLPAMTNAQAMPFLSQFVGRNLRIHVSDGRMFIGQMRCTDKDRNTILAQTHEYRQPSAHALRDALSSPEAASSASLSNPSSAASVKLQMTSRFVGLVVVPGQYITKIEYEQSMYAPEPEFPEAPEA
ncbi:uncharacterized protein J3D65DRAFT_23988 [Phyllosticta citribraziliensis]|uniref:Sm domain-containing protein n=1 Tax=Phyllosticta citribraziliensis TaxID=989973 RepID=A0ABR1MD56_9PEZI